MRSKYEEVCAPAKASFWQHPRGLGTEHAFTSEYFVIRAQGNNMKPLLFQRKGARSEPLIQSSYLDVVKMISNFFIIDYSHFRPIFDCVLASSPKFFNGEL